ncbi:class I SAM-dependent methyltransferase [Edaphobacter albus]|uniref:class I SAM-dependent methyltransferase n=1 Tax=Edaphobacter sp. 4G125 TaxID=2763071 RepID=UPI0016448198|nr:class I SAM-dependent methyltransferase [Edaphobacter sp. 4G125]QNI36147.1 class I SAM-dependent methyltransferase [Edaphobacter sp. 4G125]
MSSSSKTKAAPIRSRDLLKAASMPIHPFDQVHETDTSGLVPARDLVTGHPNDEHVTAYYAVAPSILRSLIDRWRKTNPPYHITDYTFLDIGSGKGRAVLLASELPFRQVVGVELNPAMVTIAEANVALWSKAHRDDPTADAIAPIQIVHDDALNLPLPVNPTVVFLFHPFEEPVLKPLLRRIETAFSNRRGSLDLLYVNAEHGALLDRHPAFHLLWQGTVPMSTEDHTADLEAIAQQTEYGSTGDELCAIYRYVGRGEK